MRARRMGGRKGLVSVTLPLILENLQLQIVEGRILKAPSDLRGVS